MYFRVRRDRTRDSGWGARIAPRILAVTVAVAAGVTGDASGHVRTLHAVQVEMVRRDPSTALGAGEAKKDSPVIGEDGKPEKPEGADGMMAGVIPGAAKPDDQKKLLPVTPWGRYVKILLSSNEFLFVN